jgi:hypothetical protein
MVKRKITEDLRKIQRVPTKFLGTPPENTSSETSGGVINYLIHCAPFCSPLLLLVNPPVFKHWEHNLPYFMNRI